MSAPVSVAANALEFTGWQWGSPDGTRVLCLHGFPQRSTSWSAVAERLAAVGVHVIALDQRGYSAGARPSEIGDYAMPKLTADVVAMIEALGAPVHLVGHDWGGVVGWQVAARRPDLVRSWTAVSTPNQLALNDVLMRDEGQRARFDYIRRFREIGTAETALLANGGAGLASVYGGSVAPQRVAQDVEFFSAAGVLSAALAWYRAMSVTDADGLGPVTVPTTYVWGSDDQAFGRDAAERTATYVQAPYRFVALDGASHWLPDETPDVLADAIATQVLDG